MKILLFNTLYYPDKKGGAEKSVQLLAESLAQIGYQPVIVCTSEKNETEFINGVKVHRIKIKNFYSPVKAKEKKTITRFFWHLLDIVNIFNKKKIVKILKNELPDVVHTNCLSGISVLVWKLAKQEGIKVVHTLRDYYLLCPNSMMFKKNANCKKQCLLCRSFSVYKKKYSQFVDSVVGVSSYILNLHVKKGYFVNSSLKHVIANGVDSEHSIALSQKNSLVQSNKVVFGFVGTLAPHKGIEYLLDAFINLNLDKCYLYIYGKGYNAIYERLLINKYSCINICFKGFASHDVIYSTIDALVVPSLWHEPFGRIVPEANSYGIPVIASDKGGLSELILEEENGFIFKTDVKGDLEDKLSRLVSNPRLITNMYYKALNNSSTFRQQVITKKYMNLYKRLTLNKDASLSE
ncbi:MAG: glycosyltransferase family 4 protein [Chlamydiota bacterium]